MQLFDDSILQDIDDVYGDFEAIKRNAELAKPILKDIDAAYSRIGNVTEKLLGLMSNEGRSALEEQARNIIISDAHDLAIEILFDKISEAIQGTEFDEPVFSTEIVEMLTSPIFKNNAKTGGIYISSDSGFGTKSLLTVQINPDSLFGSIDEWATAVENVRSIFSKESNNPKGQDPIRASKSWARLWETRASSLWAGTQMYRLWELRESSRMAWWGILNNGNAHAASMSSNYGGYPTPTNSPTRFVERSEQSILQELYRRLDLAGASIVRFIDEVRSAYNKLNSALADLDRIAASIEDESDKWVDYTTEITSPSTPKSGSGSESLLDALYDEFGDEIFEWSTNKLATLLNDLEVYGGIVSLRTTSEGRVEMTDSKSGKRFRPTISRIMRSLGG